jgi:hypothetical protein
MKFRLILLQICLVTFLFYNSPLAQPQLWEIYSISGQPYVNVTLDKYESDSLYIRFMNQVIALHQDSIKYLIQRKESSFGMGFIVGSVLGGVVMSASVSDSKGLFSDIGRSSATITGVFLGGAIGGLAGLAGGADIKYNLEKLDSEEKRIVLKRLLN